MPDSSESRRNASRGRPPINVCPADLAIGRYKLIAELGMGGMAVVYVAVLEGIDDFSKLVALKILSTPTEADDLTRQMFLDEARLSAQLSHPNIVQTYEVGEYEANYFIAMEYLRGQPLSRLVRGDVALPLAMLLRVISDACAGLHYAHEATDVDGNPLRLVHRDVSPQNVMVTYEGAVKVLDFGIAKWADARSETTSRGVVKGKLGYMAPEYMLGSMPDQRIDVYSMGVVLWEALTGRSMWGSERAGKIFESVVTQDAPAPSTLVDGIPEHLDHVCRRALERHPEDRYATAAELQSDLEAIVRELGEDVTTHRIGSRLSRLFERERMEERRLVGEKLRELRERGSASGPLPRVSDAPIGPADATVLEARVESDAPEAVEPEDGPEEASRTPGAVTRPAEVIRRRNLVLIASPFVAALLAMLAWGLSERGYVQEPSLGAGASASSSAALAATVSQVPVIPESPSALASVSEQAPVPSATGPGLGPLKGGRTPASVRSAAVDAGTGGPVRPIDTENPFEP